MSTDIETNLPPTDTGAAGVQGTNPTQPQGVPGVHESTEDQGLAGQSDPELDENGNPIEPAPELDEWEDEDGKKHRVPKALVPRLMKDADYTRKTQEHAEVVRQAEQRLAQTQQQIALQAQAQQQHLQQRAQLAALDMELAKYQGVNWSLAAQQDPGAAQQAWLAFQQLKEQRTGVEKQVQSMEAQFLAQAQRQSQAAQQQAQEAVARIVSQWTPEDRAAINEVGAKVYGVKAQHFEFFAANPGLLPILRDAVRYQQAQTRASSAAKPPAAAPAAGPTPTLQPGTGRATPRSLDDPSMSMDEWMRRRREQLRKRK
jgi:hypothetical protein